MDVELITGAPHDRIHWLEEDKRDDRQRWNRVGTKSTTRERKLQGYVGGHLSAASVSVSTTPLRKPLINLSCTELASSLDRNIRLHFRNRCRYCYCLCRFCRDPTLSTLLTTTLLCNLSVAVNSIKIRCAKRYPIVNRSVYDHAFYLPC